MDPGRSVGATVRYEIALQGGPYSFTLKGIGFNIATGRDLVVIVRRTYIDRTMMDEQIVGIIGDSHESGTCEFLRLAKFMSNGGVIGLHKDLLLK